MSIHNIKISHFNIFIKIFLGFEIQYKARNGNKWKTVSDIATTKVTLRKLIIGTEYEVKVSSLVGGNQKSKAITGFYSTRA